MPDTMDWIGGGVGAGGIGYAIYEGWKSSKVKGAWAEVVDDAEELKLLIGDYIDEVNAIIAAFNTAYANHSPVDSDYISAEEARIAEKEKRIAEIIKEIYHDLETTKNATDLDVFAFMKGIWDELYHDFGVFFLIIVGGLAAFVGVKVGFGVYKFIKKVQDDLNDKNKPTGTSGKCPNCGEIVTGANADEFEKNMQRHVKTVHVVDLQAVPSVLPYALPEFYALPDWVQKQIAVEAGITSWYYEPAQWSRQISVNPRLVAGIIGAVAVTAAIAIVAPEIAAGLAAFGAKLAPLLALA